MAAAAGAAAGHHGHADTEEHFAPAAGPYTRVPPPGLGDIPEAAYSRSATPGKVEEMMALYPDARPWDLLRFLKARDGDVGKATEMYGAHVEWARRRRPVDDALVRRRFCFCARGRDVDGNAIVVYHGGRHEKDDDAGLVIDVIVNSLRQAVDRSRGVERKVTLLAFTVAGTPQCRSMWREVISALSHNCPETLARVLVFPTDMFSRVLWRVIRVFLDPVTARKVTLLSGGRRPDALPEHVPASSIPAEFGGEDPTNYDPLPPP